MPRPKSPRRLGFDPKITYFKPAGVPLRVLEEVELQADEIEAIKLHDYEKLDQNQVAQKMNISQPTVARILQSTYYKITSALVEGKAIKIKK